MVHPPHTQIVFLHKKPPFPSWSNRNAKGDEQRPVKESISENVKKSTAWA